MKAKDLKPGDIFTVEPPDPESATRVCLSNNEFERLRFAWPGKPGHWHFMGGDVEINLLLQSWGTMSSRFPSTPNVANGPKNEKPLYPEHEKLEKVRTLSQVCGEFLEWLEMQGLHLGKWDAGGEYLVVKQTRRSRLLAEFFDIDEKKLEQEKQAMLDEQRKLNPKRND